jgi:hypothetical protein
MSIAGFAFAVGNVAARKDRSPPPPQSGGTTTVIERPVDESLYQWLEDHGHHLPPGEFIDE